MLRLLQSGNRRQLSSYLGLLLSVLTLFLSVTIAGCGGGGGGTINVPNVSLNVTPNAPVTPVGVSCYLNAIVHYGNGESKNVTEEATWSSADKNIATIDETGKVTPVKVGTVEITASYGRIDTVVTLTVTDAALQSIKIESKTGTFTTPSNIDLNLIAIGTFTDGSSSRITEDVAWSSSDTAIATVDKGVVSPLKGGEIYVSATSADGKIKAEESVTITDAVVESVTIGSKTGTFDSPVGEPLQLTAQANYSDGTSVDITSKDATEWQSDSTSIATVDKGVVRPIAQGNAGITATFGGVTGSATVTVTGSSLQSLKIVGDDTTPFQIPVKLQVLGVYTDGSTQEITEDLTWKAEGDATVLDGEVTPTAVGEATITVSYKGLEAKHELTITGGVLESLTIGSQTGSFETPVGVPLTLTVQANYSDGNSKDITGRDAISWTSASTSFATVYNGVVDAVAIGSSEITATFEDVSATQEITVTDAVLQSIAIEGEDSTPANLPITLKAMGTYSDGHTDEITTGLTWSVVEGEGSVNNGKFTPAGKGTDIVKVTSGDLSAEHNITVTDAVLTAIELSIDGDEDIAIAGKKQLIAKATLSDGSVINNIAKRDAVNWVSDSSSVATVAHGTVTISKDAQIGDTFKITASVEVDADTVVSGSIDLTVNKAAPLVSIQLVSANGNFSAIDGGTDTISITGTYADDKVVENLDPSLFTWTVENNNADPGGETVIPIVSVENGVVNGLYPGLVNIVVTYTADDSIKASHEFEVTPSAVPGP